jgi:hypothetical protein
MLGCVTVHASPSGGALRGARPAPALVTPVTAVGEADRAIAEGADLIDVTGVAEPEVAAIRARHGAERLWTGSPAAVDADGVAARVAGSPAAVVAAAAVSSWVGAPAIRTRHVVPVRRAIDMTLSIAGDRLPALTTRGLA